MKFIFAPRTSNIADINAEPIVSKLFTNALKGAEVPKNSALTGGMLPQINPNETASNGGLIPRMIARNFVYMM